MNVAPSVATKCRNRRLISLLLNSSDSARCVYFFVIVSRTSIGPPFCPSRPWPVGAGLPINGANSCGYLSRNWRGVIIQMTRSTSAASLDSPRSPSTCELLPRIPCCWQATRTWPRSCSRSNELTSRLYTRMLNSCLTDFWKYRRIALLPTSRRTWSIPDLSVRSTTNSFLKRGAADWPAWLHTSVCESTADPPNAETFIETRLDSRSQAKYELCWPEVDMFVFCNPLSNDLFLSRSRRLFLNLKIDFSSSLCLSRFMSNSSLESHLLRCFLFSCQISGLIVK
mmetsp:Transcript_10537/g.11829  ORF Transcript_10537/g.11829 Transcript_10537/m.11829 type:complete len:283 (+) Transcript_10537:97-945(+)